jgi:two-component system response regulator AtoC
MSGKQVSVLIVDDSEDIGTSLRGIFEAKGYTVETAVTAKEGLEKAEQRGFNIALIDIKLPDRSGVEVLKEIRRRQPTAINIMITGYANLDNAAASLNEGAFAYLQKPLNIDKVLETVKRAAETQQELAVATEKSVADFIKGRAEQLRREGKLT